MQPVWTLILPLLTALAPQSLDVRGTTNCPSATQVLDRLAPLLSPDALPARTDWLELRDVPSRNPDKTDLEMRLNRAGLDTPLGVRRVVRSQSCSETIDSVAVIAATWIANFPTSTPTAPPLPDTASPTRAADHRPSDGNRPARVDSLPGPQDVSGTATARATLSPESAPFTHFALGAAGGLVTGAAGGTAASIQVEGEVALGTRWLFRLAGTGTGNREIALGMGKVSWEMLTLFPAAMVVWRANLATVEIGAGPVLALTSAQGRGFPANGSDTAPSLGAAPTARVARRLNGRLPVTLWLAATTNLWLQPPTVQVDSVRAGGTTTVSLPAWDAGVTAGFAFSLNR